MCSEVRRVEGRLGRCRRCNEALGDCEFSSHRLICNSDRMQVLQQGKGTDRFGKADHLGVRMLRKRFDIETDRRLSRYPFQRLLAVSRRSLSCAI